MTEQEIRRYLRQMKEEDSQTALQKFYDLCFDRFFRIAYYYLKQEEWAQEVVLDVFMKIWEKRESLQTIVNLEDYFFITVKNAALNYLAKEERQKQITEIIADKIADQENSPEEILINEELFSHYVKALDRLPEKCREIFVLSCVEGLKYQEVADKLGVTVNTVKTQVRFGYKKVRSDLNLPKNTLFVLLSILLK